MPYATIQLAHDDFRCRTIFVRGGSYVENVLVTRSVEIRGRGTVEWSGKEGTPILDVRAGTVTLSDLTITRGVAPFGAGISNAGTLTLDRVMVLANRAVDDNPRGAGIANTGNLRLVSSQVSENHITLPSGSTAAFDWPIAAGAGIFSDGGSVTLSESELRNNGISAQNSNSLWVAGGGLYGIDTRVTIESGSNVTENFLNVETGLQQVEARGAGVYLLRGELRFSLSRILGNRVLVSGSANSAGYGGGLYIEETQTPARLDSMSIESNEVSAFGQTANAGGGGVYLSGSMSGLVMSSSIIGENAASAGTEALTGSRAWGGGIGVVTTFGATVEIQDSSLVGNHVSAEGGDATGAGISIDCNGGGAFVELLFERSGAAFNVASGSSTRGGFAFVSAEGGGAESHVVLRNSTLAQNSSLGQQSGSGGAIFLDSYGGGAVGRLEFSNATLSQNEAFGPGGAFRIEVEGGGATHGLGIRNSIVWGNIGQNEADCPSGSLVDAGGNSIVGTFGCKFATGLVGFVAVDPRFDALDTSGPAVLNLTSASPAIDLGDPAGCRDEQGQLLTTDELGRTRPQGMRCDVGAVEFQTGI